MQYNTFLLNVVGEMAGHSIYDKIISTVCYGGKWLIIQSKTRSFWLHIAGEIADYSIQDKIIFKRFFLHVAGGNGRLSPLVLCSCARTEPHHLPIAWGLRYFFPFFGLQMASSPWEKNQLWKLLKTRLGATFPKKKVFNTIFYTCSQNITNDGRPGSKKNLHSPS